MSSFIRYRRLQMPRMGNANFKRNEKIRSEREILDRLFPNWGVYQANKPCSVKNRNIDTKVIESESDRDSLGGCTSSDESTMSHRRLDHPPSENESGSNSDSAMDPGSSSDSEKTSDEQLNSLSETISRISISSVDSAIDDKVSSDKPIHNNIRTFYCNFRSFSLCGTRPLSP